MPRSSGYARVNANDDDDVDAGVAVPVSGAGGVGATATYPPLPAASPPPQQPPQQHVPQQHVPQQVQQPQVVVTPNPPVRAEFLQRVQTRLVTPTLGRYYSQGWQLVKANLCNALLMMAAALAISVAFTALYWLAVRGYTGQRHPWDRPSSGRDRMLDGDDDMDDEAKARMAGQYWVIFLGHAVSNVFLSVPLESGAFLAVFNAMRTGAPVVAGDLFGSFRGGYYPKLLALSAASFFLVEIGYFLLVVPGLVMQLLFSLAVLVHREHPYLGVSGSLRVSSLVVKRYVCNTLGFYVLAVLVLLVGLLCLLVGVFVAIPVVFAAKAYLYHHFVGANGCVLEPGVFLVAPASVRRRTMVAGRVATAAAAAPPPQQQQQLQQVQMQAVPRQQQAQQYAPHAPPGGTVYVHHHNPHPQHNPVPQSQNHTLSYHPGAPPPPPQAAYTHPVPPQQQQQQQQQHHHTAYAPSFVAAAHPGPYSRPQPPQ